MRCRCCWVVATPSKQVYSVLRVNTTGDAKLQDLPDSDRRGTACTAAVQTFRIGVTVTGWAKQWSAYANSFQTRSATARCIIIPFSDGGEQHDLLMNTIV